MKRDRSAFAVPGVLLFFVGAAGLDNDGPALLLAVTVAVLGIGLLFASGVLK